jgi:Tfp pilus assembly protein FimT
MQIKKSLYGFTIVELMVVVVSAVLLFTAGFANFRQYSRRKPVEAAILGLQGDLRLAQQYASSGHKPVGCETLESIRYIRGGDGSYYHISAQCSNGEHLIKRVEMPVNLTVSSNNPQTTTADTLIFLLLDRGVAEVSATTAITITDSNLGYSRNLTVSKLGRIYVN